ncbi:hypothetical protein BDV93DRAFT_607686 [Ceratobasidium sp. AG-I]|nr:hypothetical protein BDV93DRAFT_607686 [Ceratobasidium sp. AG-I]
MPEHADRWGISYRAWAISHSLLTLFGASAYSYLVWHSYDNAIHQSKIPVSSSEKLALIATGLVYTGLATFASAGFIGCLKRSVRWVWVYEKFTWTFFAAQIGVAGWFIYAVFVDQKGLLSKCKNVFGTATGDTGSMNPEYESLDPAKACRLLGKWGPIGATLGCLVILAKELDGCYVLRQYLKGLKSASSERQLKGEWIHQSNSSSMQTLPYPAVAYSPRGGYHPSYTHY